jgi:hypothetical protein
MTTVVSPFRLPPHASLLQGLEIAVDRAVAQSPDEGACIRRGHRIAVHGGVRLWGNGLAEVQSPGAAITWYVGHGLCGCGERPVAPDGHCPHWWATRLLVWAQTWLAQTTHTPIPAAPLTPYDVPWGQCYPATYQGLLTAMQPVQGRAELVEPGWCFFQPDGGGDGWDCPEQEVVIGPGIVAWPEALPQDGRSDGRVHSNARVCSTAAEGSGSGVLPEQEAL